MASSRRGRGATTAAPERATEKDPNRDDVPGDFSDNLGAFVARNPRKIVAVFLVLLFASLPALYNLSSFLSIYDLLPTGDYYDANFVLNNELGADNVMFVLTTPEDAENVTTSDAIREMDRIMTRFEDVDYVEATFSLGGLVKVLNFLATGQYELPPDDPQGDQQLQGYLQLALDQYGEDMVYDFVLTRDHDAAVGLIIMERGHSLQQYRDWQVELKELGLEMDDNNPYREQTTNQPISIDVIYANLDQVTITEGPLWILAALSVAATSAFIVLKKRWFEALLALFVLGIAISVTITAGYLVGVRFTMLTMLLIALILGAGIDYAMHVIARYQEERALGYGVRRSITLAARHVGSALFITTVTTVVGFVSLYFSRIQAIGQFGIMVGAGMLTAYLACITLLPALLQLADSRKARKRGEPEEIDEAEAERMREQREAELHAEQSKGLVGGLAKWNQKNRTLVVVTFIVATLAMGAVIAFKGVSVWGASYIDPPILAEDTYPMQVLNTLNDTIGIPAEGAVVVSGDMTRPSTLAYLSAIEEEMTGRSPCPDADGDGVPAEVDDDDNGVCTDANRRDHGILNGMSTASVVKLLYPTLGIPTSFEADQYSRDTNGDGDQDSCPGDADNCPDGIPDTSDVLRDFYDRLYDMPTMQAVMYRVLSEDYQFGTVRYFYSAQPPGSFGTDVDNYRVAYDDMKDNEDIVVERFEANGWPVPDTEPPTGVLAIAVEVNDAIARGNSLSTYMMFGTTFVMIYLFWRRAVPTLITMIPVSLSVIVQYFIIALLDYEITYVSIILTGMALGIGIDDGVHLVSRFKEEMTKGKSARRAATLANQEIGRVLIATTVTTLAPFFVITRSDVVWGANTAWMTIPTLSSALLATIFLLPVILAWHGQRRPDAWVTRRDMRLAGRADDEPLPAPAAGRGSEA